MTIRHKKSGKEYSVTSATWAKMQAGGRDEHYTVVSAPEPPKEIKKMSGKQKPESDNDRTVDELPSSDAGEVE